MSCYNFIEEATSDRLGLWSDRLYSKMNICSKIAVQKETSKQFSWDCPRTNTLSWGQEDLARHTRGEVLKKPNLSCLFTVLVFLLKLSLQTMLGFLGIYALLKKTVVWVTIIYYNIYINALLLNILMHSWDWMLKDSKCGYAFLPCFFQL